MKIHYNQKTDLLYIRIDERKQQVENERLNEYMVADIGEGNKIVGLEIMNASKNIDLSKLLPIEFEYETK